MLCGATTLRARILCNEDILEFGQQLRCGGAVSRQAAGAARVEADRRVVTR